MIGPRYSLATRPAVSGRRDASRHRGSLGTRRAAHEMASPTPLAFAFQRRAFLLSPWLCSKTRHRAAGVYMCSPSVRGRRHMRKVGQLHLSGYRLNAAQIQALAALQTSVNYPTRLELPKGLSPDDRDRELRSRLNPVGAVRAEGGPGRNLHPLNSVPIRGCPEGQGASEGDRKPSVTHDFSECTGHFEVGGEYAIVDGKIVERPIQWLQGVPEHSLQCRKERIRDPPQSLAAESLQQGQSGEGALVS
ncbi:hypothetical protein BDK51DRAFT_46964 [Blyttiomyces helicus]|uniref:Uncharacterized protein n=1 Tax=Blyttiomyces helicus TaxID=388810 RepID=A0A4P9WIX5_9FUNG|nr:hypothetical protein BDK51DRAFT_46964 [Blyttiomyces helicus]|eukprot:RKO92764.1 hypothetical protein BDK51DRAFT_46964 [Blyttiomyces helicus]